MYSPRGTRAPYPLSRSVLWKPASCILERECRGEGHSTILGEREPSPQPNLHTTHTHRHVREGHKTRGRRASQNSLASTTLLIILLYYNVLRCIIKTREKMHDDLTWNTYINTYTHTQTYS